MPTVSETPLPEDSLLRASSAQTGGYTDCFEARVLLGDAPDRAFERFVFLFFDSWLFRLERIVLRLAGKGPKTLTDPLALARGEVGRFAAWHVEDRGPTELLMAVTNTPILTWLSIAEDGGHARLRFGSAIRPHVGSGRIHWGFRVTMGAHRTYSRLLLRAAVADWMRGKSLPDT